MKKKKPMLGVAAAILIVILVVLVRGVWGIYHKYSRSRSNLAAAQTELQELQEREEELSFKIQRLRTEHGIEEEIVSKYNVAKEGERVIHILDGEEVAIEEDIVEEDGLLNRFWKWLTG